MKSSTTNWLLLAGGAALIVFALFTAGSGDKVAPKPAPKQPAPIAPVPTPEPTPPAPTPPPRCPNCPRQAAVGPQGAVAPVCDCGPDCHCAGGCLCCHPPQRVIGAALEPPCSEACTCGCQSGECCRCAWDGAEEYRRAWRVRNVRAPHAPRQPVAEDEPMVDLKAVPERPRNVGGKDGAGLCVFTSIMYAARYQGEPRLSNFQTQMRQEPGGGYPSKVDKMIAKYGPGTAYAQYEGKSTLGVIELALKTGRPASITWGGNHMLSCVYLDAAKACILDNNAPDKYSWYSRDQFVRQHQAGGGGWVVVLLADPPPPPPRSSAPSPKHKAIEQAEQTSAPETLLWPRRGGNGMYWRPGLESRWGGRRADGREITCVEDFQAALSDDSAKPYLTVIGPQAQRAQVLADLDSSPALAPFKGRYHARGLDPSDWMVKGMGFVTTGQPTIYVQSSTGQVLHRQDDYQGGAEGLAKALSGVQGLRKPDPTYDPSKDPVKVPDAKGPQAIAGLKIPWSVWVVAGVGLVLFASFRKGGS